MYLVELFLPLQDNERVAFPRSEFEAVEKELSDRFGGVTSYPRAPATGLWDKPISGPKRDDLVVYEVMTDHLDENWWGAYRIALEKTFRQEQILIRAEKTRLL